ncbi:MAG: hypothetical protein JXR97_16740 [Planctomycetes bacterium]|nr:hypothetical protein [Planctomycetota bacterium]
MPACEWGYASERERASYMAKESKCIVPGCTNKAHAKGYCRKHYGQIWRKGKIYSTEEEKRKEKSINRDDTDRMRALERELRRAEMMYRNVVGFEGRLKWRREIDEVRKEMTRLGMEIPEEVGALD